MKYIQTAGFILTILLALLLSRCFVKEKCYRNEDCPKDKICDKNSGECVYQCKSDADCGINFKCENHKCIPVSNQVLSCPPDMANIENSFCIDLYEASRPDATDRSSGTDNSYATSRKGVLPWLVKSHREADEACRNAGKRLCTSSEWYFACAGKENLVYSYGNNYDPKVCNGIDTFCNCDDPNCSNLKVCPYPHCYNESSSEGGGPCGSDFRLMPTGSFPNCKNKYGVYDINGNVWEHIFDGSDYDVRGGAYNCGDSETLHRCDYVPSIWKPSALGFRCCLGRQDLKDAGEDIYTGEDRFDGDRLEDILSTDISDAGEQGCIEEDTGIFDDISYSDVEVDTSDLNTEDEMSEDSTEPDASYEDISDIEMMEDSGAIKTCPSDMINIENRFCIDRYEASRPDATPSYPGSDSSYATSRSGVIPWYPVNIETARKACESAGKRLCRPEEWFFNCTGTKNTVYVYGNTYSPTICNGIDAFCNCDNPSCADLKTCPYPHCYNQSSSDGGGPCGANLRVMPTGSFPDCLNEWGVYDINGNVWEIVDTNDGLEHFRGGAYNCGDSELLHRCDYDATWGPSAKGFRCCKDL